MTRQGKENNFKTYLLTHLLTYLPKYPIYHHHIKQRKLNQDILYVMLNILLGKSILENSNLNINNKVNLSVLEKMISDHYNTYDKDYKCIYKLREFKSNYEYSVNSLKNIHKIINKNKSNI